MFGGPIAATYQLSLGDFYKSEATGRLFVGEAIRPGESRASVATTRLGVSVRCTKFYQYMHRECSHLEERTSCPHVCQDSWLEYVSCGTTRKMDARDWTRFQAKVGTFLDYVRL